MAQNTTLFEKLFAPLFHKDITYNNQFPSFLDTLEPNIRLEYSNYLDFMRVNQERKQSYKEYDEMDMDIIAAALDLWADDATQMSLEDSESFYIDCENREVRETLEDMFFHQLHIDDKLWEIVRTFAKYGDYFIRVVGDNDGVKYCDYSLSPDRVVRIDFKGAIAKFIVDEQLQLNPWDIVHFKMPGGVLFPKVGDYQEARSLDDLNNYENAYTYGRSPLYNARRTWKQLNLIEDSLVLLRLSRSLKRNIFMVNTTGLAEPKVREMVDTIANLLKRNKATWVANGTMESYNQLMNPAEDIILPVTGEKGSLTIQELGGDADVQHVADLDYVKNKLYGDLTTPKSYLGIEEGLNGRNTLRMLDVRYARTIKNLQHVLIIGLERIGRIHLSLKGLDPFASENDFNIRLPYISTVEEAEKVDALSIKLDAVQKEVQLLDQLDPDKKLLDRYELIVEILQDLGFEEEDISRIVQPKDVMDGEAAASAIGSEG
jgi:hypothetical protein